MTFVFGLIQSPIQSFNLFAIATLRPAKRTRKAGIFHGLPPAQARLNLFPHCLLRLGKGYFETSIKKPTKPGEGAVEKNQLKKSPLRRLARSS
jgi:hypothetical protein